mgnify:FL=1
MQLKEQEHRLRNKMTEENKKQKVEEKEEIKDVIEDKKEVKKEEKETKKDEKKKTKKNEAVVNAKNVGISTLYSIYLCKFIKHKKIDDAIEDLEKVIAGKKAVPMKGEIPHRKGKIMSGRFPINSSKEFIKLLKSLKANANANDINNPVIVEAIANMASRPFGRFGRVRRKRTHISIKAKEKIIRERPSGKEKKEVKK